MKKFPLHERLSRVKIIYAASATIAGLREAFRMASGKLFSIAAVAIVVRGHRQFTPIALTPLLAAANSRAMPSVHRLMPYLEIVYARCGANHFASMLSGGDSVRICGLSACLR